MRYNIAAESLCLNGETILESVPEGVGMVEDTTGTGVYLSVSWKHRARFWRATVGTITSLQRFTACYRKDETFWMEPCAGTLTSQVPGDTQWLLARREDGRYVLIVPIIDGDLRFSLDGRGGQLQLWADSGDPYVVQESGVGAFLAVGDDPYLLQEHGARAVMTRLQTGALASEKKLPEFVDWFGWCTWNAFYTVVSAGKVREGLQSFRDGGMALRYLILDDGWLSAREVETGGKRLTAFAANEKFPGGLKPLTTMAKEEFGLRLVLAWHAFVGYWAGVDAASFGEYEVRDVVRMDGAMQGRDMSPHLIWMGTICGMVPAAQIARFFNQFHRHLAEQGIDGVKVDNQGTLELSCTGLGSRVAVTKAYREGLEGSVRRHFQGRLINCMSNANETHLMARDSTLLRTSTDFWPLRPETHGLHLYTNAQVGMWFGQFIHPDWDMFESGHEMGAYHAAGRAISGSPVYVADKPGEQDFEVLKKLVCSDGTVLRCTGIGRPAPDCIFHDPTREDVLLKIFNFNEHGAVLGVFHCRHDDGKAGFIAGVASSANIPGLPKKPHAVLTHSTGEVRVMAPGDRWPVTLHPGGWEIYTFAPVQNGLAVLGLADKYNSGGAIYDLSHEDGVATFSVRDGGLLCCYTAGRPASVTAGSNEVTWEYDAASGLLKVELSSPATVCIATA